MPKTKYADALKFLKNMNFPATPESLLSFAKSKGADRETINLLLSLPDVYFESVKDVQEAFAMIERGDFPLKKQRGRPRKEQPATARKSAEEKQGRCFISESRIKRLVDQWNKGELLAH